MHRLGTARPARNETTTRPASHTVLTRRIRRLETRRSSRGDKGPGHQESLLEKGLDHHGKPLENGKGLPAHPVEPTYPCCLSALGEFGQVPPRGEPCIHTRAPPNPPPNPSQHSNPTAAQTACSEGAAGIDTTPPEAQSNTVRTGGHGKSRTRAVTGGSPHLRTRETGVCGAIPSKPRRVARGSLPLHH